MVGNTIVNAWRQWFKRVNNQLETIGPEARSFIPLIQRVQTISNESLAKVVGNANPETLISHYSLLGQEKRRIDRAIQIIRDLSLGLAGQSIVLHERVESEGLSAPRWATDEEFNKAHLAALKAQYIFLREEAKQRGSNLNVSDLVLSFPDKAYRILHLLSLFFFVREFPSAAYISDIAQGSFIGNNWIIEAANNFYQATGSFDQEVVSFSPPTWSTTAEDNLLSANELYLALHPWSFRLGLLRTALERFPEGLLAIKREHIQALVNLIAVAICEGKTFTDFFADREIWQLINNIFDYRYISTETKNIIRELIGNLPPQPANPNEQSAELPYAFQIKVFQLLSKEGFGYPDLKPEYFLPLDELPGFNERNMFLVRPKKGKLAIVPGMLIPSNMVLDPSAARDPLAVARHNFYDKLWGIVDRVNERFIEKCGRDGLWIVEPFDQSFNAPSHLQDELLGIYFHLSGLTFPEERLPEVLEILKSILREAPATEQKELPFLPSISLIFDHA